MAEYKALYPCGTWPPVARIPLAPRLPGLAGRLVYIVKSWIGGGLDDVAEDLAKALTGAGATAVIRPIAVRYSQSATALWAEMDAQGRSLIPISAGGRMHARVLQGCVCGPTHTNA